MHEDGESPPIPMVTLDHALPVTSLQIWLADGRRLVQRFNLSHRWVRQRRDQNRISLHLTCTHVAHATLPSVNPIISCITGVGGGSCFPEEREILLSSWLMVGGLFKDDNALLQSPTVEVLVPVGSSSAKNLI